jgi:alpha-1,3-rhamnosyl/mannosyltransferase
MIVVPLAPDARFVPPSRSAVDAVRQKYQLPAEYVLYLGSNKPHKNLTMLVRGLAQAQVAKSKSALVIAGPWDARYPEARAIAEESSARIYFVGAVEDADLPALYAGATLFVFPSLYEGFGLPPLEAMACGTPVVCSNTSSLPEVVGEAALTVNPRDATEIANAITHVLDDAGLRDRLRERGLARAAQFSWEHTARETLQVYRDVIGEA